MKNKRLNTILVIASIILLIPFIAMQFTNEVNWTLPDFLIGGVLLFVTGLLCEFIIRKTKNVTHRIVICAAILILLVLVWAELAVGIFGTPFSGSIENKFSLLTALTYFPIILYFKMLSQYGYAFIYLIVF